MDKLEAVQKVLRFSEKTREWVQNEHKVYFDDFDNYNVSDYEEGRAYLADAIIKRGLEEGHLDEEDIEW